jgi:methionyl aminopeptidase
VHEPPQIFNFGTYGGGLRLQPGMVLAFEPMLVEGNEEIAELDGHPYTFLTADEKLSAHFEHTVVITPEGYEILTKL